jgi:uncharacterized membrane protein YfhO
MASGEGGEVRIVAYEPERVELEVHLDAPAYLVLTDAYYPGWTAEVNGQPVDIVRADLYFRAVALEAGEQRVTFRFQPASARLGLAVSAVSWLAWLVAVAIIASRTGQKTANAL